MAAGLSIYSANRSLDKLMRATDYTPAASYWIGLFTAATAAADLRDNDVSTATEVTGNAYARVEVRGATGITWSIAAAGLTESEADVTFPEATGLWGDIYAIGVLDAASAGNCIMYAEFTPEITIDAPDIFKVPSGSFDVSM